MYGQSFWLGSSRKNVKIRCMLIREMRTIAIDGTRRRERGPTERKTLKMNSNLRCPGKIMTTTVRNRSHDWSVGRSLADEMRGTHSNRRVNGCKKKKSENNANYDAALMKIVDKTMSVTCVSVRIAFHNGQSNYKRKVSIKLSNSYIHRPPMRKLSP